MQTLTHLHQAIPIWSNPQPMPAPARIQARVFVVDDDEIFCRRIEKVARKSNIQVVWFHPDHDFDRLPADGEFDAGIIDYDLGNLLGTQLSSLYAETPLILVSSAVDLNVMNGEPWPRAVRAFIPKRDGVSSILVEAVTASKSPF